MANNVKGHIAFEERAKWDAAAKKVDDHVATNSIHVPTPPDTSAGNYYLGNDLQWHKVPSATIVV